MFRFIFIIFCLLNLVLCDESTVLPINHRNEELQLYDRSGCGKVFHNRQVLIESPGYPISYQSNENCEFIFESPVDCKADYVIQFLDFQLESSSGCYKDKLIIGKRDVKCGKVIGIMNYRPTSDGILKILFRTDSDTEDRGFRLLVTRSPCNLPSSNDGEIESETEPTTEIQDDNTTTLKPNTIKRIFRLNDTNSKENQYLNPNNCDHGYNQINPSWPPTNSIPNNGFNPTPGVGQPANGYGPQSNVPIVPNYQPTFGTFYPTGNFYPPQTNFYPTSYFPTVGYYPNYPASYYPGAQVPNNGYPTTQPTDCNYPYNPGNTNLNPYYPNASPNFNTNFPYPTHVGGPNVETQSQVLPNTLRSCCQNNFNRREFYLSNLGVNRGAEDCLYYIERAAPNICHIRIEFKHLILEESPLGCIDDFIEIDGQRLCGCKSGLVYSAQWGLGAKVIRFKASGRTGDTGKHGFLLHVTQEQCPLRLLEQRIRKETKQQFDQRAEGPVSKFYYTNSFTNRCEISTLQLFRLAVDPLWYSRPICVPPVSPTPTPY